MNLNAQVKSDIKGNQADGGRINACVKGLLG